MSQYSTKLTEIMDSLTSFTGHVFGLPLKEIREKLISVVQPLYDELIHKFTTLMDLIGNSHSDVIAANPEWWEDTKQKALQAAEHKQSTDIPLPSGNLLPIGNAVPASTGGAKKSPKGHIYTVEG